ncbi:MAG TPA: IclR family transcriptional regulator [Bryobacteraceae bacterium]|jgi:IclR family pca regulon transcriptional regulator|nr:IclR family transcriptional regulator [Bryobacteraceae bacterium]
MYISESENNGITRTRARDAKSMVLSLAKGFRVLEVFSAEEPQLTLSQIATRAALDPGTAFRLVKTLVMLGYLQPAEGKSYRLGWKILDLGFNAFGRMDLHTIARPILRSLVGSVNEAASIGVLDGPDVVYVERVQSGLGRLGVTQRIGARVPAYCTAIGHAILAYLPFEQRVGLLNARERVKLTPNTPVSLPEIEARLERVRALGYAVSDQDTVMGVRVIAAPILDPDQQPWAAVSAAAPWMTCSLEEFIRHTAGAVLSAAQTLTRVLRISGSTAIPIQPERGRTA